MIVGAPVELDCVSDRCVHSKRNIAEDTLGRSNDNSVGGPTPGAAVAAAGRSGLVCSRWGTEACDAF